jgi:hypothetical protein
MIAYDARTVRGRPSVSSDGIHCAATTASLHRHRAIFSQLLHIGRLEGLDLPLGMDWLTTYGVAIGCAAQTIRMGSDSIPFGRAMAVNSGDLVHMAKTVRVLLHGVQRVACRIEDPR